jgi:integrase
MKLEKREGRAPYYVCVQVPRDLRRKGYPAHVRKSTKTADKRKAEQVKGPIMSELYSRIARMREEAGLADPNWQHYVADALEMRRRAITRALSEDGEAVDVGTVAADVAENEVEPIFGADAKKRYIEIAEGAQTPISDELIEAWLSDSAVTDHTRDNYRGPIREFIRWHNGSVGVEQVDRRTAGQYVTQHLKPMGAQPATIKKKVSALSGFWNWLYKRGYAERNPWQGQQVPTRRDRRGTEPRAKERPFTDAEVKTLVGHAPRDGRRDLLITLLLTGMRLKEAVDLQVSDCGTDQLRVREAKNINSVRTIPIHSGLATMLQDRCRGKPPTAHLFDDVAKGAANRASAVSKWFTRFRRDLSITEESGGRRERVNLHSARRWFVTKAEEAGYLPATIAPVVGHGEARQDITAHYSAGPGWETLRSIVESVKLPE